MRTVLIAAATSLGLIKQRGEYADAIAFADTDALRALEAISRQRPDLIVLESAFAATSRGNALINRIKADPALAACEVRVVTHSTEPVAAAEARPVIPAAPAVAPEVVRPEASAPPPTTPKAPLDVTGTRRSPRVVMAPGTEVLVDGNPATLLDLSIHGAQLISPTTLKPNQRVRVTLPGTAPLRLSGEIAWANFEMPQTGPRYRAGLAFIEPDVEGVRRFLDATRK